MLSDRDIRAHMAIGDITLTPYPSDVQFQPNSIDVHLGDTVRVRIPWHEKDQLIPLVTTDVVRVTPEAYTRMSALEDRTPEGGTLILAPGAFVLAALHEHLALSPVIAARVEGKSSWGRRGLAIHVTAGYVDAGYVGVLTLELVNLGPVDVVIPPRARIAQLSFERLSSPALRPYGHPDLKSSYKHDTVATGAAAP